MGICYLQCGHILDYYHGIYIDLDIYAEYSCHLFESISLDNIHEIFAILKDKDIIIEDPLNLNGIFTQYQNLSELEKNMAWITLEVAKFLNRLISFILI